MNLKMCIDRAAPRRPPRVQVPPDAHPAAVERTVRRTRLVSLAKRLWQPGQRIRFTFLDGSREQQDMVLAHIHDWSKHGNVHLDPTDDHDAPIRIQFARGEGSWSFVGNQCLDIALDEATMNFGWEPTADVVRHEVGHALGHGHEHQNPSAGIDWLEEDVYRQFAQAPNYWDRETTRWNILRKYEFDEIIGTEHDADSVMRYFIDPRLQRGGTYPTSPNHELSEMDKSHMASVYGPAVSESRPAEAIEFPLGEDIVGEIGQPLEVDTYRITLPRPGLVELLTTGGSDLFMALYEDDPLAERALVEDDDSGPGRNPLIFAELDEGSYLVRCRHYSDNGTGRYRVFADFRARP